MIFQTDQTYMYYETLAKTENRYRNVHKPLLYHKHINHIKINVILLYLLPCPCHSGGLSYTFNMDEGEGNIS